MIGPIKTVGIYVQDQEVALDFYTNKLGFELRRQLAWRGHLPIANCKLQIANHASIYVAIGSPPSSICNKSAI